MNYVKIIAAYIVAAIFYGIVHDQITARVCLEYFTVFHPPVFATQSPTLLGVGWGVIATWWVGLFLGIPLAVAAQAGNRPALSLCDLTWPIGFLLLIMAGCACIAGIVGYISGLIPHNIGVSLPPGIGRRFAADLWAHNASYLSGSLGGIALCILTWRGRGRRHE